MAFEVYSNEYLIRGLMKSLSVEKCACFQWQLALFFPLSATINILYE